MAGDALGMRGTRIAGASHRRARGAGQQAGRIDRRLSPPDGRDDPACAGLCRRLPAEEAEFLATLGEIS